MKRIFATAALAALVTGLALTAAQAGSAAAPQVDPDTIISTMNNGMPDHALPPLLFGLFVLGAMLFSTVAIPA